MPSATTNGAAPVTEARAAVPRSEPRLVKPVPITLDKDRTLVMDFTAMDAFEEATGLSAWGREAWSNPSPRILSALIWAGLLHEDPSLTLEAVRAMPGMHLANLAYLSERVGELWGEIMPEADVADEGAVSEASDDPNPRRRPG